MGSQKEKIELNKYDYSVRASQAVLQYGVGAMVDFPGQTLMTAAPENWHDQVIEIHDERLERVLHVDFFGLPGGEDDGYFPKGISFVRFPEWYFCPDCRRFKPITDWIKEYRAHAAQKKVNEDPYMRSHIRCPQCNKDLVVTRFVTVCECGHIDDFPWVEWVHCKNINGGARPVCEHPSLRFRSRASSAEELEGITVFCESCKAKATLRDAFDKDIFSALNDEFSGSYDFRCKGRHPWKNKKETCGKYPKVLQRGSSSVYFPVTESSLVIPPYSSLITKWVYDSKSFSEFKNMIAEYRKTPAITPEILRGLIQSTIDSYSEKIALEIGGVGEDQVRSVLERKLTGADIEEGYSTSSVRYRSEEYDALNGDISVPNDEYGEFKREGTDISDYNIPYVKNISLIHKIREVQALTGFSRLNPIEAGTGENDQNNMVYVKEPATNWYPAYEVRGEGIFIVFDEDAISDWQSNHPEVQDRVNILNENYKKSFFGKSRPRKISAKFLLLHTISHLLIKQLSFECGYGIASLKERLYCSDEEEGKQMAGILIYTASGDSEGTLGGLVRQGFSDVFPSLFRKALEAAMTCSNDPVCSLSMGQGRDSLNLSACYSCALIPETSCEEFNVFLDRGTVVGTYENREMGFYFNQLYADAPWENTTAFRQPRKRDRKKTCSFIITDPGADLSDTAYSEIWDSLKTWSEDESELNLLSELIDKSDQFDHKEKPRHDCRFQITGSDEQYTCDLYWENSKTAFFSTDNEDAYLAAKNTDICCFLGSGQETTFERIINKLMEI